MKNYPWRVNNSAKDELPLKEYFIIFYGHLINFLFSVVFFAGSPEMAFIHALAAATVTSFIARACRDGQLASCGCSSGSRPKQLHDDWNWGGCGDNLEYAYK